MNTFSSLRTYILVRSYKYYVRINETQPHRLGSDQVFHQVCATHALDDWLWENCGITNTDFGAI